MPNEAPYGSWKSPITSDLIASATVGLGEIAVDGEDVYWLENRPSEGGRSVIVRRTVSGAIVDVTPPGYNVRTRVHEYGGGAFAVTHQTVYFSNFADGQLYRQETGSAPQQITEDADMRYADLVPDCMRDRLICIREDHTAGGEPENAIVSVSLKGEGRRVLVQGGDFYASPQLSPDGSRLAWLTWNHPNMPWDGTELWVGTMGADGAIHERRVLAGGKAESIFAPRWSADGTLYFVSDQTGWWNLYRNTGHANGHEAICPMDAEFGLPQWVFGMSTYAFSAPDRLVCTYADKGLWRLGVIDLQTGQLTPLATAFTEISDVQASRGMVAFVGASATAPRSIVRMDMDTLQTDVLRQSATIMVDEGYLSSPHALEFPTENDQLAYGFYYPPRNKDFAGPPGQLPPLVVVSHGGPTSAASPVLSLRVQYWTSRGIAVLDVNYGGSTGYGRVYRERLNGNWGRVDVDDCVNGALFLVRRGDVCADHLAIRGGSAGGYTTLCALTFRAVFAAGASYYGVSDVEALATDTHKFEARYLDTLIGPYPQNREIYVQRSPIHYADRLNCPVIFFQGLADKVVPPDQAQAMFHALRSKGLPVAYIPFADEGHGFRRAENIKRAMDAELHFYARVFGFATADAIEPVVIENVL